AIEAANAAAEAARAAAEAARMAEEAAAAVAAADARVAATAEAISYHTAEPTYKKPGGTPALAGNGHRVPNGIAQSLLGPGYPSEVLKINGEILARYWATFDANSSSNAQDEIESGFQIAKARLKVKGSLPETDFSYTLVGGYSRSSGDFELDDAFIDWKPGDGFGVRVGQFKLPFTREFGLVAPAKVLLIDRSLSDSIFRADRSQGIMFSAGGERVQAFAAFSDGRKAKSTDFTDTSEADAAVTFRMQGRLGEASWKQFKDMTAFRGDKTGWLFGAAVHWQQDGETTAPTSFGDNANYVGWTADIAFESSGWNISAAVNGAHISGGGESLSDFGVSAQGGVFLSDHFELIGRYSHVFPDEDKRTYGDDFAAFSVGMNYYPIARSQAIRVTGELTYFPGAQADSKSLVKENTSIGLLDDDDDGQLAFGMQLQLLF
ncbi:MAG: porin, partial [Planctomycetota bacterium]